MRPKIVSVDSVKGSMKLLLKQVLHLSQNDKKQVIDFFVKSIKRLKALISGRVKRRQVLFSKCIARCKNSDGFVKFVIRRKEYGIKSTLSGVEYANPDAVDDDNNSDSLPSFIPNENNEPCTSENENNEPCASDISSTELPQTVKNIKTLVKLKSNETEKSNINLSCSLCKEVFNNHKSLTNHLFNHAGSPVSCFKCNQTFNNLSMLKIHFNEECFKFRKIPLDELLQHLTNAVKNCSQKYYNRFHCPYCGHGFVKPFNLKRHLQNNCGDNKMLRCNECNKTFCNEIKYSQHLQQHNNYKCLNCDLYFLSKKLLKSHSRTHEAPRKRFICELCKAEFPNRSQYRNHNKQHATDEELTPAQKYWKVWCNVCRISFFDYFTYKRHCTRKSHLSKVTNDKELLNMKIFMCVTCGKLFSTKDALSAHCGRMHITRAHLSCDQCSYTTPSKSNMNRHTLTHEKALPRNFVCHQCPSTFKEASVVKEHINSVHSEERLFACDSCPKTFKLKKILNRHKSVHSPISPFTCTHCGVNFKRKSHLKRHTEVKHKEYLLKLPAPLAKKGANLQNDIENIEKSLAVPPIDVNNKEMAENIQLDGVFSLIDAQSGELVTLSATELSKNAVINMADGELLNQVHIPELWNEPNTIYTLDPLLQNTVLSETQYIMTQDGHEIPNMLPKSLEAIADKNTMEYCIVPPQNIQQQRTQDGLHYFYV